MFLRQLAQTISITLGQGVILPLLLITFILRSGLTSKQVTILLPTIGLIEIGLPLVVNYLLVKTGRISSWGAPTRSERYPLLITFLTCALASQVIINIFGNSLLFQLNLILITLTIALLTITFYWKISLHAGINTATAILINFLFNWQLPELYLLIPTVIWARYYLKLHTLTQLLAGSLICAMLVLTELKFFKLI